MKQGTSRTMALKIVLTLVALACLPTPTYSFSSFRREIPNGDRVAHPCGGDGIWQGVGHTNPSGGGERNSFGLDFRANGYRWTTELCLKDSDNDGKTNGQELGDPFCEWSVGRTPQRLENITHPGVCDPVGAPWCAGSDHSVSCTDDQFSCPRIEAPEVRSLTITFPETQVPPSETNYYCMTFDLPADQDYHLIANEPIIDNIEVMHHMLLFGCPSDNTPPITTPTNCDMSGFSTDGCTDIIALWSVGIQGTCLKDDVAFRFGRTSYKRVVLQVHWNNPFFVQNYRDASGLRLYYRPVMPMVSDLFTFIIGQLLLDIPPGQPNVTMTGTCPGSCTSQLFTKTAYVTHTLNHMHYLGIQGRTELFRNGVKIRDLAYDERYSYDAPIDHEIVPPAEVRPGDELRVTCSYNSMTSSRHIYFGSGTADEMCFAFLTMYPADAMATESKECNQAGVVSQCQLNNGEAYAGCDWATLPFEEYSQPAMDLAKNCNLDGFCRPECLEVVERLLEHPCLRPGQPMTAFVNWVLQNSDAGARFLGRFHSCSAHASRDSSATCSKEQCGC